MTVILASALGCLVLASQTSAADDPDVSILAGSGADATAPGGGGGSTPPPATPSASGLQDAALKKCKKGRKLKKGKCVKKKNKK